MNIILFFVFASFSYYTLLILPRNIDRKYLIFSSIGALLLLSITNQALAGAGFISSELVKHILNSLDIIVMLSIARQLSIFMVDKVAQFHIDNNASNLNRTPIRQFVENREGFKKFFIWFSFIASLVIFAEIWITSDIG